MAIYADSAKCPYCTKTVNMTGSRLGDHRTHGGVCDGSGRDVARLDRGRAVLAQRPAAPRPSTKTFSVPIQFDARSAPDGAVRERVWDLVAIPGDDLKGGQSTSFNRATLTQMVINFANRGDLLPMDAEHLSTYVHVTGTPSPALAFYGALAVVWNGALDIACCADGVVLTLDEYDAVLSFDRDGLFAFRTQVTPQGHELLDGGGYRYLSPTFVSEGTMRDGTPIGYCLLSVACTNTPWQPGTQLNF